MLEIISKDKKFKVLYRKIKVGTIFNNGNHTLAIDYKNNNLKFEKLNDALSYFVNYDWNSVVGNNTKPRNNICFKTKNYKRWGQE